MKNLTLENIAAACGGELKNSNGNKSEASSVVIDSRKLISGGVFIATVGERVDGHDFIDAVSKNGALGVVCEKEPESCLCPYILVKDSFRALREIAGYYRKQLPVRVVGITGSVGKTSTKEFIAAVLSVRYRVCKTQGNFNNEIGLPLTILSIGDEDEVAVVEMGISDFGEMERLTEIARPDTCVITNIGQCHLEKLGSRDGVLKAKTAIFKGMPQKGGTVILNGDDDKLKTVKVSEDRKLLFYGRESSNDIYADEIKTNGLFGTEAVIRINDSGVTNDGIKVNIPLPGEHMVYNALAASAVGHEYGLNNEEIRCGIEAVQPTGGRSNIIKTGKYTLIDDCYNANPVSMKAAVELLSQAVGRRVAILGDMFELGGDEKSLHYEVGKFAAESGISLLITIGTLSENMYEGAARISKEGVYHFDSIDDAMKHIPELLKKDDTVLIKASHGMHFERITEQLRMEDLK